MSRPLRWILPVVLGLVTTEGLRGAPRPPDAKKAPTTAPAGEKGLPAACASHWVY